jgi:hypothetical protein
MSNDVDKQIRNKIKAIIQPAYPLAVIFPYNALSHDLDSWPGLFRLADGGVHGWIIKRAAAGGQWKTFAAKRDRPVFDYDVWSFYKFRPESDETSNSDNEFGQITDTAYEDLRLEPILGLDGIIDKHDLLQYQRITTVNCGEEILHFAQGRLTVHLCC